MTEFKKTEEPFWKRELKEVFAIYFTFFILFVLFAFLKKAMLGQYNIEYYAVGTALIGSLILGKVVLIFDKLPMTKKNGFPPKYLSCFFQEPDLLARIRHFHPVRTLS